MQRRTLLTAAAAAPAILPFVARAQGTQKATLRLKWLAQTQFAGFYLAKARGYYEAEGLEPSFDVGSGSVAAITRVASGAYDMGFGDISALIEFNASQAGAPLLQAVYQYYNRAPFVIIGRKDRGITQDFKSLQGKRIAAAAVESTRRAWPMAAKHAGMKAEAIEWVTTDFSQRDNVIIRGDVDGATYFHDSALSLFQRLDPAQLSVLSYADAGLNLYGNAILASTKLMADKPQAVRGFLKATNRALLECLADPAGAMQYVKRREPMVDEKVEAERFKITAGYVATADARNHGLGDVRPELVRAQVAEVSQTFALKQAPNADALYNLSFLPPKADRLPKA